MFLCNVKLDSHVVSVSPGQLISAKLFLFQALPIVAATVKFILGGEPQSNCFRLKIDQIQVFLVFLWLVGWVVGCSIFYSFCPSCSAHLSLLYVSLICLPYLCFVSLPYSCTEVLISYCSLDSHNFSSLRRGFWPYFSVWSSGTSYDYNRGFLWGSKISRCFYKN